MTAYIQDAIVLFGDSITQGGWEAGGFAQRLARVLKFSLNSIHDLHVYLLKMTMFVNLT